MLFTGNPTDLSQDGKRQLLVALKENALLHHRTFSRHTLWGESQNTTMKSLPIVLGMAREQASSGTHPEQAYTFHPLHRS